MEFDPVFLTRLQFAWVIGWHILLPAFTVGAAAFIPVPVCTENHIRVDDVVKSLKLAE